MKLYLVGGCVRDKLMGVKSKDFDYVMVSEAKLESVAEGYEQMKAYLNQNGFSIFLETPDCFTIRARFPKGHKNAGITADFVLARKEVGYIEGTRRPILELGTLHDDLLRRDFTVNAIAEDDDGNLIDPFNGQADISAKILRCPIDPNITMLDDPLRFLRAFRFSITKNFDLDDSIMASVVSNPEILDKLLVVVSKERIREELTKMFKFDTCKTLRLLTGFEDVLIMLGVTKFLDRLLDGMWLKPTTEH